jgi:uncharacterized protein YegL
MPRRPKPLDPDRNPVHRFAQVLREAHRRAGKPTRAWLGRQMHCSHATVSHILNGDRFPSWQQTAALITACGEDPESIRPLWVETDAALEQGSHHLDGSPQIPTTYRSVSEGAVMPIYLACDVSGSMGGAQIEALNAACVDLIMAISADSLLASLIRFGLVTFSDTAEVLLPLADLRTIAAVPVMVAQGGTHYGSAFRLLREAIDRDVGQLQNTGYRVYRPVVFFMTDGQPVDPDWQLFHQGLTDPGWAPHPHILAFGLRDVPGEVLEQVATFRAFIADEAASPVAALKEFTAALMRSVSAAAPRTHPGAPLKSILFDSLADLTAVEGVTPLHEQASPEPDAHDDWL